MAAFGSRSLLNLRQCHPALQRVAHEAIRGFDFAVICGERGRAEQETAFAQGTTRAHFGESPHNFAPALAFDAVPWPLDWNDLRRFREMADVIKGAADRENVPLTWGGDFKRFRDRPHFELSGWKALARGAGGLTHTGEQA